MLRIQDLIGPEVNLPSPCQIGETSNKKRAITIIGMKISSCSKHFVLCFPFFTSYLPTTPKLMSKKKYKCGGTGSLILEN